MNSSQWRWPAGGVEATVVLPSVLGGLGAAGAAGNLLLVAVLVYEVRRGKRSAANALLLNVGAADLLLALGCLPPRVAAYARRAWPGGGVLCRADGWLLHGCLVAKSLSWAALSHARYRHHLRSPAKRPAWSLAGLLAAVWGAALLLPLPLLLFGRLEEGGARGRLFDCAFRPPAGAAGFIDVFGKVYPLAAYVAPAAFTWACYGRALRLRERGGGGGKRLGRPSHQVTRTLLGLSLLFQATWLPQWLAWLWERHRGGPPPALLALAEVLLFLDAACNPAVFAATSGECRAGLRGLCGGLRCRGGRGASREPPQPMRDLDGEAAPENVLPDVEHFWKDRRNAAPREESDPVPWEHQCDP
ncbi:G-protein coupled receptor 151 protein-like [Heteronotia binoei]|uniref:G-protein coupled receptor 151 protein-like n=1 Tax=Heteronotia binoei TaxID=13085 RepID=UPI002930C678|nr:G-protein coupled receptor 151 protein-like [Heteronotia binoei]